MRIKKHIFHLNPKAPRQFSLHWEAGMQFVSANLPVDIFKPDARIELYVLCPDLELSLITQTTLPLSQIIEIKTVFVFLTNELVFDGLNYLTTLFCQSGEIHLFCD